MSRHRLPPCIDYYPNCQGNIHSFQFQVRDNCFLLVLQRHVGANTPSFSCFHCKCPNSSYIAESFISNCRRLGNLEHRYQQHRVWFFSKCHRLGNPEHRYKQHRVWFFSNCRRLGNLYKQHKVWFFSKCRRLRNLEHRYKQHRVWFFSKC